MVRRWMRVRGPGWWWRIALNGVGALVTGGVMLTIAMTKFSHGAWIVVLLIPTLVALFLVVHRHYETVASQLSLEDVPPPPPLDNTVLVLFADDVRLERWRTRFRELQALATEPDHSQEVS